MKKILKGLLFALVAVFGVSLASCTETPEKTPTPTQPAHTHTLADGWKRDSATHWHECSGCDELVDLDVHDYGDWTKDAKECKKSHDCKVCGFRETVADEHSWGEWTAQEDGSMTKECSHCHQVESVAQYYLKGAVAGNSGIVWDKSEAGKFVIDYKNMTAKLTITLAVGDQFKVGTASGWEFNIDNVTFAEGLFVGNSDGNLVAQQAADYEIELTGLAGTEHKCSVTQLCVHDYTWTKQTGKTCDYDGVCKKCEAKTTKVEHTHGAWTLVSGKTCDYEQVCVCGDKKTKVEHTWGEDIVCDKCKAVNVLDYYVKGSIAGNADIVWGASEKGKLVYDDATKSASIVLVLKANDEFKVGTKDGWEFNATNIKLTNVKGLEGTDNVKCTADGVYVVTVSGLDKTADKHSVTVNPVTYYVKGDMNGWAVDNNYKFAYDKETDTATLTVVISDPKHGFKVADGSWAYQFGMKEGQMVANDGGSGNINVTEAGTYKIVVTNVVSQKEPTCTITKVHGKMTAAEVNALTADDVVLISGKVEYKNNNVVLTDSTGSVVLYNFHGACIGDEVTLVSKWSAKNKNLSTYISTKVDKDNSKALEDNLTKVTSVDQLTDGMEVIIGAGEVVMGPQSSTIRLSVPANDACTQVVKLVKSGDNWLLQVAEGQYLYWSSGNSVATGDKTDASAQWKISFTDGVLTIENVKTEGRKLQYNQGSPRFACYTSVQVAPELYVAREVVVELDPTKLTATADKEKITQAELPEELVLTGDVTKRIDKEVLFCVELAKQKKGTLSFTAEKDCVVTLTIGSTSSGNQSYFAVICGDEYVTGSTSSENLELLEDKVYLVSGTKYAENAISFHLEAGKTYTFAAVERANPEADDTIKAINGRAVRVTSIVIAE